MQIDPTEMLEPREKVSWNVSLSLQTSFLIESHHFYFNIHAIFLNIVGKITWIAATNLPCSSDNFHSGIYRSQSIILRHHPLNAKKLINMNIKENALGFLWHHCLLG